MAVNIVSAYAGEVLEKLLTRATTTNELVEGGHIRLEPNVRDKFYIPRLKAGSMLQKRVEQPTSDNSKGDFDIDEKCLEPKEFMAYTEFNPRSFEKIWRKWQPEGALVFAELPVEAKNALLAEMSKVVSFELGDYFVNGEYGSGTNQLFNGILTRIAADGDVLSVDGAVALTTSNITGSLRTGLTKVPKAVRKQRNLKIFMSVEDGDNYDEALTKQSSKGKDHTEKNPERYKGIPIVTLASWPKDVIVFANTSMDLDTNFWGAVSHVDDAEAILIDKISNAGEKYFFKMLLKADTNVAFGEEIVLWDGRSEE